MPTILHRSVHGIIPNDRSLRVPRIRSLEENVTQEQQRGLPSLPARYLRFLQPPIYLAPKSSRDRNRGGSSVSGHCKEEPNKADQQMISNPIAIDRRSPIGMALSPRVFQIPFTCEATVVIIQVTSLPACIVLQIIVISAVQVGSHFEVGCVIRGAILMQHFVQKFALQCVYGINCKCPRNLPDGE